MTRSAMFSKNTRGLLAAGAAVSVLLTGCKKDSGGSLGSEGETEVRQLDLAQADGAPAFADTSLVDAPNGDTPLATETVPAPSTPAPEATVLPAPEQPAVRPTRRSSPAATASVAPVPEPSVLPAPEPKAPSVLVIQPGTSIGMVASARACAPDIKSGQELTATVDRDYEVDGYTALKAGATVVLRVQQAEGNRLVLAPVRLKAIDGDHPISGIAAIATLDTVKASGKARAGKAGVFGALAGAAVGAAMGKDAKAAIIGGAVGAAAGASAGAATAGSHVCLPEKARLAVQLDAPVRVTNH